MCLAGAQELEVKSQQEMVEVLERGTLLRATGAHSLPVAWRPRCCCTTRLSGICALHALLSLLALTVSGPTNGQYAPTPPRLQLPPA